MKFEECEIITDQYGFKFAKNGIMLGEKECDCLICHAPTKFIEICSEVHFCSDECVQAFHQKVFHDKIEADLDKYEEIKKFAEYILVEVTGSGYAYVTKEVTVKKDIPIELSANEIAKYADDWNYCFGGSITKIREDDDAIVYHVKIYTD